MNTNATTNTKHAATCRMAFGRLDYECPRCLELACGAERRKPWFGKYDRSGMRPTPKAR